MEKPCRSYDLSVACTGNVHHLGRLGAEQYYKAVLAFLRAAVLLLLLSPGHAGKARQDDEKRNYKLLEKFHRSGCGYLRTFSFQPSRSKSQSPKRGSMTMYVVLIFDSMNSFMAFSWSSALAWSSRRV